MKQGEILEIAVIKVNGGYTLITMNDKVAAIHLNRRQLMREIGKLLGPE